MDVGDSALLFRWRCCRVVRSYWRYCEAERARRRAWSDARRIALVGSVLSPMLLISDLGRPARFLAMLRVFKPQSPMSVGVWVLVGFSGGATAANAGDWLEEHSSYAGLARLMQTAGDVVALLFGLPLATYTESSLERR